MIVDLYFLDIAFYVFALGSVVGCMGLIFSNNMIHAALNLIIIFFSVSTLFVIMGAEFLGLIFLLVYIGAVAILFLFGMAVLMPFKEQFSSLNRFEKFVFFCVPSLLLAELLFVVLNKSQLSQGKFLHDPVPDALTVQALGEVLYTDYVLVIFMVAMILFVAMVGAVALIGNQTKEEKKMGEQRLQKPGSDLIDLKSVPLKKGTKQV